MTPFTPQNRDNMISWMAARSDFPEYGKMLFYELPKEKLVYGPNQIEAMIDQNTTISQQLTLRNQQGSRVIRGKQIVTPIENSFLYVVPVYLKAEGTNFPQLKRVIAVAADKVVMEPTLDDALNDLFGKQQPQAVATPARAAQIAGSAAAVPSRELNSAEARMRFEDAQQAMEHGDWDKSNGGAQTPVGQSGHVVTEPRAGRRCPGFVLFNRSDLIRWLRCPVPLHFRSLDPSSIAFYSRRSARTEMTCRSACFQCWRDWISTLGWRLPN